MKISVSDIDTRVRIKSKNSKFKGRLGTIKAVSVVFNEATVEIDGTNGMRRIYVADSLESANQDVSAKSPVKEKSVFIVFNDEDEAEKFEQEEKSLATEPVIYMAYTVEHGIKQIERSIKDGEFDDDFPRAIWFKGKAIELKQRPSFYVDED